MNEFLPIRGHIGGGGKNSFCPPKKSWGGGAPTPLPPPPPPPPLPASGAYMVVNKHYNRALELLEELFSISHNQKRNHLYVSWL